MWTHVHPYEKAELTAESIERHGRMALYRALSLRRVVGFIGSGVTIAYGQPTWAELAAVAIEAVRMKIDDHKPNDWPGEAKSLAKLLGASDKDIKERVAVVFKLDPEDEFRLSSRIPNLLALCEATLKILAKKPGGGTSAEIAAAARKEIAREILSPPKKVAQNRLTRAKVKIDLKKIPPYSPFDFVRLLAHLITSSETVSPNQTSFLREHFEDVDEGIRCAPDCDIIKSLMDLGLRRFVTLNYDVEIERRIAHEAKDTSKEDFGRLLSESEHGNSKVRKTQHAPGVAPSISVEMCEETAADLINFSAHPKRAERSVFHLHGRADRPEGMILTEDDYKRLYVKDGISRRIFRDGQEILLSGNDVLFVGVGMEESDVLGALRLYMTRDPNSDTETRETYVLIESVADTEDSDTKYSRDDVQKAIDLKIKYGVSTLFFGRRMKGYRQIQRAFKSAQEVMDDASSFSAGEVDQWKMWLERAGKSLTKIDEIVKSDNATGDVGVEYKQLPIRRYEVDAVNALRREIYGHSEDLTGGKNKDDVRKRIQQKRIQQTRRLGRLLIAAISSRMRTRALMHELEHIEKRQQEWWRDWRVLPRFARPTFNVKEKSEKVPHPVWSRQAVVLERSVNEITDFEMLKQAQAAANPAVAYPCPFGLRILRLAMTRGAGRGTFLSMLQNPLIHKQLFPKNSSSNEYQSAFFASTAFSIQFNSVIQALCSMLAGAIAKVDDENDEIAQKYPHRVLKRDDKISVVHVHVLDLLKALMEKYVALYRSGKVGRIFLCLGGLDRLCDSSGHAFSPTHRAFFRMITAYGFDSKDWPLDLVLVSSWVETPLAYLSEPSTSHDLASSGVNRELKN